MEKKQNPPRKRNQKGQISREPIEKSEDVDVVRELSPRPKEAVVELKTRMIAIMKGSFKQWDENNPGWASDERHKKALQYSVFGLSEFFDAIDDYVIGYKDEISE